MGLNKRSTRALAAAAVMAVLAVGCGGGGSSSSDTGAGKTTASGGSTSSTEQRAEPSSKPSSEFVSKGENGKLATLGKEASAAERETASRVIEENLKAREAGDWATQCSSLAAQVIKTLEKSIAVLGGSGKGCVKGLEAQAQPVPASVRANTMSGPIDAFRINGDQSYAFYHGAGGKDYVIPLLKEGDEWKLAALTEQEIR